MTDKKVKEPDLFNEAELEAIRKEAMGLELELLRKGKRAELLKEARKEARRSMKPEEALRPCLIDLPGFARDITLDQTHYLHGVTYYVTEAVEATLLGQMRSSWRHEKEIGGVNDNAYRVPRHDVVSPSGRTVSTSMRI